jgi:hypothetical protein
MSFNGIGATGGVCHFRFHSFVCVGSEPGGWMSQLTALRADRSQPAPGGGPVPGSGNHGGYGPVDTFIGQKGRMRPEGVRRSRAWTVVRLVGLRIWICRIVTTSSRVSCGKGHADGRIRWRDGATVGAEAPSRRRKGSPRCTGDPLLLGWNATIRAAVAVGPVGRCAPGADRVARDDWWRSGCSYRQDRPGGQGQP